MDDSWHIRNNYKPHKRTLQRVQASYNQFYKQYSNGCGLSNRCLVPRYYNIILQEQRASLVEVGSWESYASDANSYVRRM